MTAAAVAVLARGAGVTRPGPLSRGVTVARQRINVMMDPAALAVLDDLAAARYGGNRSRALDDAVTLAALVLNRPEAFGRGPAAALAAYCGGSPGEAGRK